MPRPRMMVMVVPVVGILAWAVFAATGLSRGEAAQLLDQQIENGTADEEWANGPLSACRRRVVKRPVEITRFSRGMDGTALVSFKVACGGSVEQGDAFLRHYDAGWEVDTVLLGL